MAPRKKNVQVNVVKESKKNKKISAAETGGIIYGNVSNSNFAHGF